MLGMKGWGVFGEDIILLSTEQRRTPAERDLSLTKIQNIKKIQIEAPGIFSSVSRWY